MVAARIVQEGDAPTIVPSGLPWGHPTKIVAPEVSTVVDESTLVVLTGHVENDRLDWAPEGDGWAVWALWVRDALQGVTSFVDAAAARAATQYLDEHQIGDVGPLLGAAGTELFEDSLELNADSLFWSADLPERFLARHGYDLTPYLPVMFAQGMCRYWVPNEEPPADFETVSDLGPRVRADYHRLITDLYVSDHLRLLQEWSMGHGLRHKAQAAYGQDLEPVRSFRELVRCGGRAEAESLNGGDRVPMRREHPNWRFALDWQRSVVGGAHQGGATRISTELGAQFGAAFDYSLGAYRQLLDKEWATGITKPYVHGFAVQGPDAPWPTSSRFWNMVAESWNDLHFPEWPNWRGLTDYWARGTVVLETGRPRTDVAWHRDGFLTTAARGSAADDATAPTRLADLEPLERRGYSVQFLDPIGLAEPDALGADGTLFSDGPAYRALVVDERRLTPEAAEAIERAARGGLRVVFVGDLPDGDSGWGGADSSEKVRAAVLRTCTLETVRSVATSADVPDALVALGVVPRVAWQGPALLTQVRDADDLLFVLVYNPDPVAHEVELSIEGRGAVLRLDLDHGRSRPVAARADAERTAVQLRLEPLELVMLELDPAAEPGPVAPEPSGHLVDLVDWSLVVTSEEPGGPRTLDLPGQGPADWRDIPALAEVSGVGVYTAHVGSTVDLSHVTVEFGELAGSATVRAGGRTFGPVFGSGARVDLGDALAESGTLEIEVRTTLRNAAVKAGLLGGGPWHYDVTTSPHGLVDRPRLVARV